MPPPKRESRLYILEPLAKAVAAPCKPLSQKCFITAWGFPGSPEFKGIKTDILLEFADGGGFQVALNSKGLRRNRCGGLLCLYGFQVALN